MKNYLKRFFQALFQLFKGNQVVELTNNTNTSEFVETPVAHHDVSTSDDTETI
jgi:hypothetical protein